MVGVWDDVHLASFSLISPAAPLPNISNNNLAPLTINPVTVTVNETDGELGEGKSIRPVQRVVSEEAAFETNEKSILCRSRLHINLKNVVTKSLCLIHVAIGIHSFVYVAGNKPFSKALAKFPLNPKRTHPFLPHPVCER